MRADDGSPGEDAELALFFERRINEQTQGRINGVRIEVAEDRLIIYGRTEMYHAKQLTL